jgi:hypothetical protein
MAVVREVRSVIYSGVLENLRKFEKTPECSSTLIV